MNTMITKNDILNWQKGIMAFTGGFAGKESTYIIETILDNLKIKYKKDKNKNEKLEEMLQDEQYEVTPAQVTNAFKKINIGMVDKIIKDFVGQEFFDLVSNTLSSHYSLHIAKIYLTIIKKEKINPVENKNSYELYENVLENLFKFKEVGSPGIIGDFIVILLNKYEKQKENVVLSNSIENEIKISMEDIKTYFCHLIEIVGKITPEVEKKYQQIIRLKDYLEYEDFSKQYVYYKSIRTLYNEENDIEYYDLQTKKYKIDINILVKKYDFSDRENINKIIKSNNNLASNFLIKKSIEFLEIDSVNKTQEIGTINIYVSYYKKTDSLTKFFKNTDKFLTSVNTLPIVNFVDSQLNELWNNVELSNEIEEKIQNKVNNLNENPIKKKKV